VTNAYHPPPNEFLLNKHMVGFTFIELYRVQKSWGPRSCPL